MLVDIGIHKLGLDSFRYSRCTRCGTEYPHATSMNKDGRPLPMEPFTGGNVLETIGPMCNGRELTDCPCVREDDLEAGERIFDREAV